MFDNELVCTVTAVAVVVDSMEVKDLLVEDLVEGEDVEIVA